MRRVYADFQLFGRSSEGGRLPAGTYGTSLLRNHALNGVFAEMEKLNFPKEVISSIRDSVDCNIYFFENRVSIPAMYIILAAAIAAALGLYVLMNLLANRRKG